MNFIERMINELRNEGIKIKYCSTSPKYKTKGLVTDFNNNPVSHANISIIGSSKGTKTGLIDKKESVFD